MVRSSKVIPVPVGKYSITSTCLQEVSCLIYVICVCLRILVYNVHCVVLMFISLRFVYPLLSVSLDCPFLIAPLVFSNVYYNIAFRSVICEGLTFYSHVEITVMTDGNISPRGEVLAPNTSLLPPLLLQIFYKAKQK